jgi:hypothetical protein
MSSLTSLSPGMMDRELIDCEEWDGQRTKRVEVGRREEMDGDWDWDWRMGDYARHVRAAGAGPGFD